MGSAHIIRNYIATGIQILCMVPVILMPFPVLVAASVQPVPRNLDRIEGYVIIWQGTKHIKKVKKTHPP